MHTDVATGRIHNELQEGVAALEQLIAEMQELSENLRDQSQWPSSRQAPCLLGNQSCGSEAL